MTVDAVPPTRLALQTGRLDDHRRPIMAGHRLWRAACELFAQQDRADGVKGGAEDERRLSQLDVEWPEDEDEAQPVEALAVALALAAPFADEARVLRAIAPLASEPTELGRLLADVPVLASPDGARRPPFPHVYDPDASERCPVVAMLDGPRSPKVAELLEAVKDRDPNLADAMVLGADLEMLDLLDRLGAAARESGRANLADMFASDRRLWHARADAARARTRLEGSGYHWCTDNVPPECIELARAETQQDVEGLLHRPSAHDPAP